LTRRLENIRTEKDTDQYDSLYRLISYKYQKYTDGTFTTPDGAPVTRDYDYSSIGNILKKGDLHEYIYSQTGTGPHAVTGIKDAGGADMYLFSYG